jgi:hypothetical protein
MTLLVPVFYALMQLGNELVRRPVDAVHQHGLVWRQLWRRGFIPWNDVTGLQQVERDVQGARIVSWEVQTVDGVLVVVDGSGASEAVARIQARLAQRE